MWNYFRWMMLSLHLIVCILMFSDLIYGNKPLLCNYQKEWYFLLFKKAPPNGSLLLADLSSTAEWNYKKLNYKFAWWPLFYLDAKKMSVASAWLPPGAKNENDSRYVLGSYDLGRDVFAGCLYGLKKSLILAFLVLFISVIPGILIGSLLVFHSQRYQKISIYSLLLLGFIAILLIYFMGLFAAWKEINFYHRICFYFGSFYCFT